MYSSSSRSLYRVHTRTWRALSSVQKLRAALRENMAFVLPFVVIGGAVAAPFRKCCPPPRSVVLRVPHRCLKCVRVWCACVCGGQLPTGWQTLLKHGPLTSGKEASRGEEQASLASKELRFMSRSLHSQTVAPKYVCPCVPLLLFLVCAYVRQCVCVCVCARARACVCVCMHACMHAYRYIYTI